MSKQQESDELALTEETVDLLRDQDLAIANWPCQTCGNALDTHIRADHRFVPRPLTVNPKIVLN